MRAVSLFILILSVLPAYAGLHVWQSPVELDSIGRVSRLAMHWRVRPHGYEEARWGIVWNVTDSTAYDGAEITLHDGRYTDALGREAASLRIFTVRCDTVLYEELHDFSPAGSMRRSGGSLRLRLDKNAAQAVLDVGCRVPELSVPVRVMPHSRIGCYTLSPADTLRHEFSCDTLPEPVYASFENVDSLRSYLSASHDANEGEWVYYDRDTEPLRISLGGDYRFATVSDGADGYYIVYVDGAEVNPDDWRPMRVKGHLAPTGFIDQYDLCWLDAFGEPMGSDCSALFTDGALICLRFPLYGSSVRYRRAVQVKVPHAP